MDLHHVCITVGGNLIVYPCELTTRTPDLTTSKVTWNRVILTLGTRHACDDVIQKNLCTPFDMYEYIRIIVKLVPQEFIEMNNLETKIKTGHIYMDIQKGMYGCPQAVILSNKLLKEHITKYG